ncbi:MAG TPA: glycosyltransferase family A protein [Pseudosphingobacterium sp.]|nr:glycosyltransferase family A protein [Pseudosphingobacterium sp.]
MGNNPKYTIAIPAFKGKYLKDCIKSVLEQTYEDYELIIVNDCSPDPIEEIVVAISDKRIQYYKNDLNEGAEHVVNNWNRCLSLAKGEYFVLLGDDDFMDANYLAEFDMLISTFPHLDVYHCRSKIVDQEGKVKELTSPWPSFENVYDNIYYRLNMSRVHFISDFVYRTASLKNRQGFYKLPLAWGSDDISAFAACANTGIAHTNKAIFNYRESPDTITRSGNTLLKMEAISKQKIWLNEFLQSAPKDSEQLLMYRKIKEELPSLILRKKADLIKNSITNGGIKALNFWLGTAKKYGIPKYLILRIFLAVKLRH